MDNFLEYNEWAKMSDKVSYELADIEKLPVTIEFVEKLIDVGYVVRGDELSFTTIVHYADYIDTPDFLEIKRELMTNNLGTLMVD